MQNNKKRAAVVTDVFYGLEEHGILSCSIMLEFVVGGASQSFGGVNLSAKGSGVDFYNSICRLFRVQDLDQIVGKRCYALYCFGNYNEHIEGIETEYGDRFTLTKFMRKYDPTIKDPLEKEKQRQFDVIEHSVERIMNASKKIKDLVSIYSNWEN